MIERLSEKFSETIDEEIFSVIIPLNISSFEIVSEIFLGKI